MGNLIEVLNKGNLPTLPANLRAKLEDAAQSLEIPGGGTYFPRISSNRRKFSIMESGVDPVVITDDKGKPVDHLDVVVLAANKGMHRSYYEGAYDSKAKEKSAPVCWSPNGIAPHPSVEKPQASKCAQCPKAVYGSKITEQGKKAFACSESKRLLVLSPDDLEGKIYMVNISYSAHKGLRSYAAYLKQHGVLPLMVETRLAFDEDWDVPVFTFEYIQMLDQQSLNTVAARLDDPDVQDFINGVMDTETDAPRTVAEVEEEAPAPAPAPAPKPIPRAAPKSEAKTSSPKADSVPSSQKRGFSGKVEDKPAAPAEEEETPAIDGDSDDLRELLDF